MHPKTVLFPLAPLAPGDPAPPAPIVKVVPSIGAKETHVAVRYPPAPPPPPPAPPAPPPPTTKISGAVVAVQLVLLYVVVEVKVLTTVCGVHTTFIGPMIPPFAMNYVASYNSIYYASSNSS